VLTDSQEADQSSSTTDELTGRFQNGYRLLGGAITGNGAGVTNAWVKTLIKGSYSANVGATINTGDRFVQPDALTSSTTVGIAGYSMLPIGGYLTNFQVWSGNVWPSTTNIVFTIQTNKGISTAVSTPITCTLNPGANSSNTYTNSATTALTLPATQDPTGYTWTLKMTTTASGGNLLSQTLGWQVEWWHQSP
jgi:hypothetical protein